MLESEQQVALASGAKAAKRSSLLPSGTLGLPPELSTRSATREGRTKGSASACVRRQVEIQLSSEDFEREATATNDKGDCSLGAAGVERLRAASMSVLEATAISVQVIGALVSGL